VFAKKRLSDELVAELARLDPWAAFEYALDRLDDDDARVVEVARLEPWAAFNRPGSP